MPVYEDYTGPVPEPVIQPSALEEALETQRTPGSLVYATGKWRHMNAWNYGAAVRSAGAGRIRNSVLNPRQWWRTAEVGSPYWGTGTRRFFTEAGRHFMESGRHGVLAAGKAGWVETGAGTLAGSRVAGQSLAMAGHLFYGAPIGKLGMMGVGSQFVSGRVGGFLQGSMIRARGGMGAIDPTLRATVLKAAGTRETYKAGLWAGSKWVGSSPGRAALVRGLGKAAFVGARLAGPVGAALLITDAARLSVWGANKMVQGTLKTMSESFKDLNTPVLGQAFKDYEGAATARARAVEQIQNSRLNARSILGAEGGHFARHYG